MRSLPVFVTRKTEDDESDEEEELEEEELDRLFFFLSFFDFFFFFVSFLDFFFLGFSFLEALADIFPPDPQNPTDSSALEPAASPSPAPADIGAVPEAFGVALPRCLPSAASPQWHSPFGSG